MLKAKITPNYAGIALSGDYEDFDVLYDAVHKITFSDLQVEGEREGTLSEIFLSERLLALAYDLRHASMADREIELIDNGLTDDKMKGHGMIVPKKNVYYSVNIIYPELMFELMAINYLIDSRSAFLLKKKSFSYYDMGKNGYRLQLDKTINILRLLQATIADCMQAELSKVMFTKWSKLIWNGGDIIVNMYRQWLDIIDSDFAFDSAEKRKENLVKVVREIAEYYKSEEYHLMKKELDSCASEKNCLVNTVSLAGTEFPDNLEW